MSSARHEAVPAFLSIDVEPDAFQISRTDGDRWPGYGAMFDFATALRASLERASHARPRFGWHFRMDPQIEAVCGRADFAVSAFAERLDAMRGAGDYFGAHMHPLRWSGERRAWVHDFADVAWLRRCTQFTVDAFRAAFGERCRLFRSGAGFLCNDIVDVLDENGVDMETSFEPVAGWGLSADTVPTAIDASPIIGAYVDCSGAPRTPYHQSRGDFRRAGDGDARRLMLVPMSTATAPPPRGMRSRLRRLLQPVDASPQMLFPSLSWRSERHYWDLVASEIERMERPYVSIAVRTDCSEAALTGRVFRLLDALAEHPLGRRLRFVDPLDAVPGLVADAHPDAHRRRAVRPPATVD